MTSSSLATGFIDLATFDELDKYMYGGPCAISYFVMEVQKASWFTQIPTLLVKSGAADFGGEIIATISRAGDYLLQSWIRLKIPEVRLKGETPPGCVRWTRHLMHNMFSEIKLTFNDLHAEIFDNYYLDFWSAFTVTRTKINGYYNMIGSTPDLMDPLALHPGPTPPNLPSKWLTLPLPFFFSRDTGVSLPTAALPYNEMRITFRVRHASELLVTDPTVGPDRKDWTGSRATTDDDLASPLSTLKLTEVQIWANYALVSNAERTRMAKNPRDILIEQVQSAPIITWDPTLSQQTLDLRFSHAIKVIFFGARNRTTPTEWSNYSTAQPVNTWTGIAWNPLRSDDPLSEVNISYENTSRLNMGSDFYTLTVPFYNGPTIPEATGYHTYSYSLDFANVQPMGSTDYGKLTNVSLLVKPSSTATASATTTAPFERENGWASAQSYSFVCVGISSNVSRLSGGSWGFPVL